MCMQKYEHVIMIGSSDIFLNCIILINCVLEALIIETIVELCEFLVTRYFLETAPNNLFSGFVQG